MLVSRNKTIEVNLKSMNHAFAAIKARIVYMAMFLKGNMSFALAAHLILPSFLRPKIENVRSFSLYGNIVTVLEGEKESLVEFIHQIIGRNQYHIELVNEGGTIVDAGANIGIFSIFVAVTYPRTTIYAFEPTPLTFQVLKENTKHYKNIKIFNCGLGEKKRIASVITSERSGANYIGEGGIPVEIQTIDDMNLPVDFIKMDTEGYEAQILNGAAQTIKNHKPVIVMSAYHKPNDKTELPLLLTSFAPYNCVLKHDCEEDLVCVAK